MTRSAALSPFPGPAADAPANAAKYYKALHQGQRRRRSIWRSRWPCPPGPMDYLESVLES